MKCVAVDRMPSIVASFSLTKKATSFKLRPVTTASRSYVPDISQTDSTSANLLTRSARRLNPPSRSGVTLISMTARTSSTSSWSVFTTA